MLAVRNWAEKMVQNVFFFFSVILEIIILFAPPVEFGL